MSRVGSVRTGRKRGNNHRAVADQKLDAMIGDSQSFPKSEVFAQPFCRVHERIVSRQMQEGNEVQRNEQSAAIIRDLARLGGNQEGGRT